MRSVFDRQAGVPELESRAAFAARLVALRRAAGLSQNALAAAAGVDPAYVNKLEAGDRHPRRHTIVQLWAATTASSDALDDLLAAAGYLPVAVGQAGGWEAYLRGWRGQIAALETLIALRDARIRELAKDVLALRRVE